MPTICPERIETDRLHLERLSQETVDPYELYRISSSDEAIEQVTEYLSWSPHNTVNETLEFVEQCEQHWQDSESATYVIQPREGEDGAGEIAGLTSLGFSWERRTAGLGIWLRKRFWGRGYSGERAAALIEMAFGRLDLEIVEVTHRVGNEPSRRAIEKYVEAHGGRHEGRLRNWAAVDGKPFDHHRYTITREEYQQATTE